MPLFVHSARFYLKAWILYQRGKDTRLRVGFLRAARRRFYHSHFARFFVSRLFSFLFFVLFIFWHFFFSFLPCSFLFLSICICVVVSLFAFLFLLFVVSCFVFLCFAIVAYLFSIYNIINKYLLFRLCVRTYARAHEKRRGKIRHTKKGALKIALPLFA